MTNIVKHFDSVPELVAFARDNRKSYYWNGHPEETSRQWLASGLSKEQCEKRALQGDESLMSRAQVLLDALETPEVIGESWSPSVAGCYPSVPDYLNGNPECMRMKISHESERAPIRVFASQFVSASVSADEAIRRGIAITALVMRLQITHPVDLYLVSAFQSPDRIVCTHVGTLPINLSVLAFNLAHVSMFRRFGMPALFDSFLPHSGSMVMSTESVKRHLGIGPKDLYVESSVSYDGILTDPLKWINEQVSKFNESED